MRPIETFLVCISFVFAARWIFVRSGSGSSAWTLALSVLLLIALAAHLGLEGTRRAMLPLYLVAIGSLVLAWSPWLRAGSAMAVLTGAACIGGLLLAVFNGAVAHPLWRLPAPSGPLAVGVTELALHLSGIDPETVPAEQAPPRVRLWYPAVSVRTEPRGLIAWLSQTIEPSGTDLAEPDAPPAPSDSPFPFIVYHGGWPGTNIDSYVLIRELVSQGYAVATLEYPLRMPGMSRSRWNKLVSELQGGPDYSSEAKYRKVVVQSTDRVRKRALDSKRVIDTVLAGGSEGISGQVEKRLDPERIAALGFSLGGGIASQTGWVDKRVKAVVDMDGRHWAEGRTEGVSQPFMMLSEPLGMPTAADLSSSNLDWRYNAVEDVDDYTSLEKHLREHGGLHVAVDGTAHLSFTDRGLTSRLKRYNGGGPIATLRAMEITNTYVLAFFDQELRGKPSPLLEKDPAQYPEVHVTVYPRPESNGNPDSAQ